MLLSRVRRWFAGFLMDMAALICSMVGGLVLDIPELAASKLAPVAAGGCLSLQLKLGSVMAQGAWTHPAVAVDRVQ